ncbi:histidinol dehydrogenase [Clostridium cylindrosporum]|uniref:Histidinol dehydrogenase n=1 Tax=Clostridium cylindrosporum DSM 605 TaxID=1121307 RepID=A0A0J8DEH7_CLOCY|nr:histidinol dehydrogenase [Clostridium cylindrosporum]KMT22593.1 histidinol dehydrogenase HisD [Clostridium cylindrosporum DSM 605]
MKIVKVNSENYIELVEKMLNRGEDSFDKIDEIVEGIISDIRKRGDSALIEYTEKFDKVKLESLRVTEEEVKEAVKEVGEDFIRILEKAKANIVSYHEKQVEKSWMTNEGNGSILGQVVTPIERVGIYVPGGKAAYPSTVLMDAVPALVAGVKSIAMVTPPLADGKVNPYILASAYVCGIDEIYKIGGAQAVAALAYGTETIKPTYKIVGPGNIFVARAKRMVFGKVGIDMIAGPSEICIIAEDGDEKLIAADLLSQAEHDEMAASVLVTTSSDLAERVSKEVDVQLKSLPKCEMAQSAIDNQSAIFLVETLEEAFEVVNQVAPEHLEVMVDNPFEYLPKIRNAGAIFLGKYSPEPLGDYFAGPNHTLPTSGTARFSSPLGVQDYVKKSSLIYYSKDDLAGVKDDIITFAENEGLTAHANSIRVRF